VFISLRYFVSVSVGRDIDEVIGKMGREIGERRERIIDFEIVGVEG
jgi:hypothetical protein